ncbi:MAG TPA: S26 family signal peptidase [Candidatus Thermoplasmatota archaeon]|nr:S26 family signal peptidase [Candidatus Thermoplasmatota archaeon]
MAKKKSPARVVLAIASWILFAAIALPIVTGRPVFSYASSGSMEPTIKTFDGFFVEPWPSHLQVGDIIVFQSTTRGGPSVHRIVGGDARNGWYTQGDANPEIDQVGGEVAVTADRVMGRVVTVDGKPVLVEGFGVAVVEATIAWVRIENAAGGARNLAAGAFVAVGAVAAFAFVWGGSRLPERRDRSPRLERALSRLFPYGILGKHVAIGLFVVLLAATAYGAASARREVPTHVVVVADPSSGDGIRAGAQGQVLDRKVSLGSLGFLPTTAILEAGSPGIVAPMGTRHVPPWTRVEMPYQLVAGERVGLQEETVLVYRYPAAFPEFLTRAMHDTFPGSPYFALASLFAAAGAAWVRALGVWNRPVGREFGWEAA